MRYCVGLTMKRIVLTIFNQQVSFIERSEVRSRSRTTELPVEILGCEAPESCEQFSVFLTTNFVWNVCSHGQKLLLNLSIYAQPQGRQSIRDRGTCLPQYLWWGTSMVMSPNILEVMSFRMSTRVTATVVCCILMQTVMCSFTKKLQLLGNFVPRPPTGAPPRTSLGTSSPRPPVFFYVPQ